MKLLIILIKKRLNKYLSNHLILIAIITSSYIPCYGINLDNNSIYSFAGIIPFIKDQHNNIWVYLGVEYNKKEKQLAILAGQRINKDKSTIETALREFNEETLDVFHKYINISSLKRLENDLNYQITYNILFLLNTKIYLVPISNYKINQKQKKCDKFIELYNTRRFGKPLKYQKLKLSQRETYGIRRVKLSDLIDFLNTPGKYNNKLQSYGVKNCTQYNELPLRWSSKILLQNQYVINHLDFSDA